MTRPALACLLALFVPAVLASDDKKPDAKTEPAALKGRWKVTAVTFDGKELPAGDRSIAFEDKQFVAFDGEKKLRALAFTIDPAADPVTIDMTRDGSDQKTLGLLVRAGDKLTICYAEPGAARPKKLESKPGGRTYLMTLERVKP